LRARCAFLLCALLALSACAWNEEKANFATRAEFQASRYASQLPSDLLPASARDIRFRHDIDTTVVEASFDFDFADDEEVVWPFMSFDQIRIRMALAETGAPAPPLPQLLLRCGEGPMEFLQIGPPGHARYWTDWNSKHRQSACSNGASRTSGTI
jgi:hypothetical protein